MEKLGHKFIFNFPQPEYYCCSNCGIIIFEDRSVNNFLISDLNKSYYGLSLRALNGNRDILNISCNEMIIKNLLE